MEERFEIYLSPLPPNKKRFETLEGKVTVSNFSEIMKGEATKLAGKTKKELPVLSTEDKKIKQLEDRKKEFRKKENTSER